MNEISPVEIRGRLIFILRMLKADTVISFDPESAEKDGDHAATARTVEDACARLGLTADAASNELRRLGEAGLIDLDAGGNWSTKARGLYFEIPDEPEAQRAARDLSNTMLVRYASLPSEWVQRVEPRLDVTRARAAGLFNARLELLPEEVERFQQDLEALLEPFINRPAEDRPPGASPVRIAAYFLPEPLVP